MNSKAYILIDVAEGKADDVISVLKGNPSITAIDYVEGPPDIVMVVEAKEVHKLAELTIKALTSVEHWTTSIQCLPVSCRAIENIQVKNVMKVRARL